MDRSVVVLDRRFWIGRGPQLAQLLQSHVEGPIDPPAGEWTPESEMTVVDAGYWSAHMPELMHALSDEPCPSDRRETQSGVGFSAALSERLTLSIEEVAAALGISRAFAYEAVHRGEIPHIKIGRRMLVPTSALHRLLAAADGPDERH